MTTTPFRVIVCGGRGYSDRAALNRALDRLYAAHSGLWLAEGGNPQGADRLARCWRESRQVDGQTFPADWTRHGRSAGPKRNADMLAAVKPDLVVAFPGGRGTADMVRRAREAGVKVEETA